MATADIVVIRARQLGCRYPADPCDGYGAGSGQKPIPARWEPCEECVLRRLAEATKTEAERGR